MTFTTKSGVSTQHVRYELGDTKGSLDEDLIAYHLDRAQKKVAPKAATWADPDAVADAVAAAAAYRLVAKNKDAFLRLREGAELRKDWDVQRWIEHFRSERDDALEEIGASPGPSLHTLGSRSTRGRGRRR